MFRQRAQAVIGTIVLVVAVAALLAALGCHSKSGQDSAAPFRIIATDAGFDDSAHQGTSSSGAGPLVTVPAFR